MTKTKREVDELAEALGVEVAEHTHCGSIVCPTGENAKYACLCVCLTCMPTEADFYRALLVVAEAVACGEYPSGAVGTLKTARDHAVKKQMYAGKLPD
jgi:hypothetical protein